jgi:ribA/ribD-fused uncharacterized protein
MTITTHHTFVSLSSTRVAPIHVQDERKLRPGIHRYSNLIGCILQFFGFAVSIRGHNQLFYVNTNSLNAWKAREKKLYHLPQSIENLDDMINAIRFAQRIKTTMGPHITEPQFHTLMSLHEQAIRSPNPQEAFEHLVNQKIHRTVNGQVHPTAGGWNAEKAAHIKKNLLPSMQKKEADDPVLKMAQTPIDSSGQRLVCFYKSGPTQFLGNFAHCPKGVRIWNKRFNCSEAAFQWAKYQLAGIQDPLTDRFFKATGEEAFQVRKQLDQKYPRQFPPNWINGKRDEIMWQVLQAKFDQNPEFKRQLESTKGAYLLEHNQAKRDDYWSDNSDGSGKNILGKMLMALRDGNPKPAVNDSSDARRISYFAQYANRGLSYSIF